MWQLKKKFKDRVHNKANCKVELNPDKSLVQNKISYPIIWKGWIGIQMVKIIQIGPAPTHESFVFEVFPKEYAWLQNKIIEWIRDYLNTAGRANIDKND
ncbi:hypothetical protein QTN47_27445 [Danxiaibacter flavus]|uniref:Uncharacterized protein n=1 Tax=Danxiaibacter flavus TaxID=3049108 RepID=A0ABV3ZP01_9BACT|nr:hypothetical protein QNM32_27445 [Chitinophagaceae bacterium DXS]